MQAAFVAEEPLSDLEIISWALKSCLCSSNENEWSVANFKAVPGPQSMQKMTLLRDSWGVLANLGRFLETPSQALKTLRVII